MPGRRFPVRSSCWKYREDQPLGIKGIGGAGTIAAPPTVVNAVIDAQEFGVTISTCH
jgi:CO/xanthine dehydrogenase Mo-binding subunit